MAFGYASNGNIDIDDIITTILDELKDNGNWTATDAGYNVVTDPDGNFDMYLALESTNKRYIQVEVGEAGTWNTSTHSMDTPKIEFGVIIKDHADAATGTDKGTVKIGYNDDFCFFITDYTAVDSDHQRCFSYVGLAHAYDGDDEVLIGGSTFNDGTPSPTNTAGTANTICVMRDISNVTNKPIYYIAAISTNLTSNNNSPRGLTYAAVQDYRYLTPVFLCSVSASYPAGGEAAGLRARLQDVYVAFSDDGYAHGTSLVASDNKEFELFLQDDSFTNNNLPCSLWFRTA
jgi:hypothetical protein